MPSTIRRTTAGLLVASVIGALVHFGVTHSDAQAPTATAVRGWDYRVEEVDVSVMQSTLVTLGRDGWDVAEIMQQDQAVVNDADGQAHVRVGRVLIIVKRPLQK